MYGTHKIRMIALDLDGTALRTDGSLSQKVQAAIECAVSEGICVVIASGRPFKGLPRSVMEIDGIAYAVVSNGAGVYDLKTGQRIYSETLPAEAVCIAVAAAREWGYIAEYFLNGKAYGEAEYIADPVKYGRSAQFADYVRTTRIPVENMEAFVRKNKSAFDSIAFVCPEMGEKTQVMERLRRMLPDVYVTTSGGDLIELMHKDAGKAKGLAYLAKISGISSQEIAAFGNGDNDVDMLLYAGCGFAMENASPLCKQAAFRVIGNNDSDDIAKVIDGIVLTNRSQQGFCSEDPT